MAFKMHRLEPNAELMDQIQVGPRGAADSRVVATALGVVLALDNVHRERALISRDAVGAVEVEQEMTHAEGAELGDAEAADGSEAGGEPVPVVGERGRAPCKKAMDHGPVDRVQQGARSALQRGQ
jgi:hypothetical protein